MTWPEDGGIAENSSFRKGTRGKEEKRRKEAGGKEKSEKERGMVSHLPGILS